METKKLFAIYKKNPRFKICSFYTGNLEMAINIFQMKMNNHPYPSDYSVEETDKVMDDVKNCDKEMKMLNFKENSQKRK